MKRQARMNETQRLNEKRGMKAVLAAVVAWGGAAAHGALGYDLRFADGSHTAIAATGSYSVELWAQVIGTDGNNHNEGLLNTFANVFPGQSSGPVLDASLVANGSPAGSPFTSPSNSDTSKSGAAIGSSLGGWGSTSTNLTNSDY